MIKQDDKAEVEYKPIKKIVIHEMWKISVEDFITRAFALVPTQGIATPAIWVDNYLFEFSFLPQTVDVVKDHMNGISHWAHLVYTDFGEYQHNIQQANAVMPIIKAEHSTFQSVAKWLRERDKN